MNNAVVDVLLTVGVVAELACCLGVLVMRSAADRLHFTSAGYTVGPFFIVAALIVREGLGSFGLDAIAVVLILFLPGPILVHATARVIGRDDRAAKTLPEQHL
jgi:multisubunit Na+/H+ antiporter MnhG subunit